jgi:hypothetical protein
MKINWASKSICAPCNHVQQPASTNGCRIRGARGGMVSEVTVISCWGRTLPHYTYPLRRSTCDPCRYLPSCRRDPPWISWSVAASYMYDVHFHIVILHFWPFLHSSRYISPVEVDHVARLCSWRDLCSGGLSSFHIHSSVWPVCGIPLQLVTQLPGLSLELEFSSALFWASTLRYPSLCALLYGTISPFIWWPLVVLEDSNSRTLVVQQALNA